MKLRLGLAVLLACLAGCPPVPNNNNAPPAVTPVLDSVTWQGWPDNNGRLPNPISAAPDSNGAYPTLPAYRVHIFVTGPKFGSSFTVSYNGNSLPLISNPTQQGQTLTGFFNFGLDNTATKWDIAIAPTGDSGFRGVVCSGPTIPRATVLIANTSQNTTTPQSGSLTVLLSPDSLIPNLWTLMCNYQPPLLCAAPQCCDGRKCCGGPNNYYA